jgi:hypothetical protein
LEKDTLINFFSNVRNPFGHGAGSNEMPKLSIEQTTWAIEFCMIWIKKYDSEKVIQDRHNKRMQPDRFKRYALSAAADAERVCQAWHETREVKVLSAGIRRAEG